MPPEKPTSREAPPQQEGREAPEKNGWEKLRGIASDVLDLFAEIRKLDRLMGDKIEKLPPNEQEAAEARRAKLNRSADVERTTVKEYLLSIFLAVNGMIMSSKDNPEIPVPESTKSALAQVEKPKKVVEENWGSMRGERHWDPTRKFAEFLKAARQSPDLEVAQLKKAPK